MQRQQLAFQSRSCTPQCVLVGAARLRDQRRAPRGRAARRLLGRRGAGRARRDARGRLLGLGRLRSRRSGSGRRGRAPRRRSSSRRRAPSPSAAWDVWPTREFLGDVAASLSRLAAGFAIGAGAGVAVGLVDRRLGRACRRVLEPLVELAARHAADRDRAGRDRRPRARRRDAHRGDRLRRLLPGASCNTIDGVRGVSPEARDTAAMLHVGPVERLVRVYLPAALPSIVAGLRVGDLDRARARRHLRVRPGRVTASATTSSSSSRSSTCRRCTAGILFLGLLGYVLNRLFLLVERRLLAWHYGAVRRAESSALDGIRAPRLGARQALRGRRAGRARRRDLRRRRRRAAGGRRAVRLRQDDAPPAALRPDAAQRRRGPARRPARHASRRGRSRSCSRTTAARSSPG